MSHGWRGLARLRLEYGWFDGEHGLVAVAQVRSVKSFGWGIGMVLGCIDGNCGGLQLCSASVLFFCHLVSADVFFSLSYYCVNIMTCAFQGNIHCDVCVLAYDELALQKAVANQDIICYKRLCGLADVLVEIDRILRLDGYLMIHDSMEMLKNFGSILGSLQWSITSHQNQFIVAKNILWREVEANLLIC
ncbi:hypothetical protein KIW84_056771 [Lathyrus oleraceus]|uniref:Methyltransferase n=1 Tax=Pisum sativum TaxID=3888 RepID=A0A9D4WZ77_PEA|nr:hypothetical protein KIW84_056771 [Pisum sativum]